MLGAAPQPFCKRFEIPLPFALLREHPWFRAMRVQCVESCPLRTDTDECSGLFRLPPLLDSWRRSAAAVERFYRISERPLLSRHAARTQQGIPRAEANHSPRGDEAVASYETCDSLQPGEFGPSYPDEGIETSAAYSWVLGRAGVQ